MQLPTKRHRGVLISWLARFVDDTHWDFGILFSAMHRVDQMILTPLAKYQHVGIACLLREAIVRNMSLPPGWHGGEHSLENAAELGSYLMAGDEHDVAKVEEALKDCEKTDQLDFNCADIVTILCERIGFDNFPRVATHYILIRALIEELPLTTPFVFSAINHAATVLGIKPGWNPEFMADSAAVWREADSTIDALLKTKPPPDLNNRWNVFFRGEWTIMYMAPTFGDR